ncbi:MAG: hypothetical protein AB1644_05390 [Candidatus Zixiibacteriota bacterium]
MAKETKPKTEETPQPDAVAPNTKAKRGLPGWIWYIVYGFAGLAVIAGIAFGTLMLVGNDGKPATDLSAPDTTHAVTDSLEHAKHTGDSLADGLAEFGLLEDSTSEIEKMLKSIEILDQPSSDDLVEADSLTLEEADSAAAPELFKAEKEKLAAREATLDRRQKDIELREQKLSQQMLKIEQASSQRVIDLAKLYDAMQPQAVANLMSNLDDTTVVAIIPRMKPKVASQVLQLLPPQRAAGISKQIITLAKD